MTRCILWQSFLRLFDGVMNLYTMKKISCFLISDFSGNDFLNVEDLCRSLRHLQVQKTTEVSLSELCSSLKSLFAPVLRWKTDKSFSRDRFPHNESAVNQWFDHLYNGETQKQIKEINFVRERETPWNDDDASFLRRCNWMNWNYVMIKGFFFAMEQVSTSLKMS